MGQNLSEVGTHTGLLDMCLLERFIGRQYLIGGGGGIFKMWCQSEAYV
jgi:hypothetical protein